MTRIIHKTAGPVVLVPVKATEAQAFAGMPTENYRAAYRAMLAAAPTDPQADLVALVRALRECVDDLEAEIKARNSGDTLDYPTMKARFDRDMEPVTRARAVLDKFTLEEDDA